VAIVSVARDASMTLPPIRLSLGDCHELETFLSERIYEFNSRATGYFDAESFGAVQNDDAGKLIGGITGYTWGGCCYVSYLWVAEGRRGKGVGSALLRAAESNARDRGCTIAFLASHSFQSPGFYTHLGYEPQATIWDYPVGHSSVFLAKRLTPVSQSSDESLRQHACAGRGIV
jgi:GNAT superfamily N-acetyltransferase